MSAKEDVLKVMYNKSHNDSINNLNSIKDQISILDLMIKDVIRRESGVPDEECFVMPYEDKKQLAITLKCFTEQLMDSCDYYIDRCNKNHDVVNMMFGDTKDEN